MEAQEQEVKLPHHFTKEYKKMKADGLIDDKGVYVGKHDLSEPLEAIGLPGLSGPIGMTGENAGPGDEGKNMSKQEDSIPTSQVQAMFEKMFAERMKTAETPKPIYQEQPRYRAEDNVDDVPELRNWEMKDRVYEMTEDVKAVTASISSQHTALIPLQYTNKETQSVHIMRYATNQPSFFVEKQSKEPGSVLLAEIMFSFGRLSVPANNIVLQKFLAIHPHLNKTFREYDPLAISRKVVSEKKMKLKAGALVFEVGDIINRAIASLEFPNYVDSWATDILEEELSAFAEKQPEKYIAYTEDNTIKMKGVIKASLSSGELVYANYRFLNKKRETILEVAKNQNELDEMVLFFESGLGRTTYEYLLNRL